jgi:hypothetical protein
VYFCTLIETNVPDACRNCALGNTNENGRTDTSSYIPSFLRLRIGTHNYRIFSVRPADAVKSNCFSLPLCSRTRQNFSRFNAPFPGPSCGRDDNVVGQQRLRRKSWVAGGTGRTSRVPAVFRNRCAVWHLQNHTTGEHNWKLCSTQDSFQLYVAIM